MIRRHANGKFANGSKSPSPAEIQRRAAEVRSTWSPQKHARRAGEAVTIQVIMASMLSADGRR